MKSYTNIIEEYDRVEKNTAVVISLNDQSLDNGKTWKQVKTVNIIEFDEIFTGEKIENGPSISGFWGNTNEIHSGRTIEYCSKFNGNRWVSLRSF